MLSSKYYLFSNFHQKTVNFYKIIFLLSFFPLIFVLGKKLGVCPGFLSGARAVKIDHLCYLWKTFYARNMLIMTLNDHLCYNSVIFRVILE